jgi:tetratricopeptide (TPR) repeat protein
MRQANVLDILALARLSSGNHTDAARAVQESLDLYRDLDNRHGVANGVMRLGQVKLAAGDYQEARTAMEAALSAYRDLADRSGEAGALNELGVLYRRTGNLERARENHLRSAESAQQISCHWDEASAWAGLGRCDLAAGRTDAAVEHLRTALAIFQRIGAAEASEVAADLDAALAQPPQEVAIINSQVAVATLNTCGLASVGSRRYREIGDGESQWRIGLIRWSRHMRWSLSTRCATTPTRTGPTRPRSRSRAVTWTWRCIATTWPLT